MKYRIIRQKNHYEIEYKIFLIWFILKEFDCDVLGFGGEYPIEFKTVEDAQKRIDLECI